MSATLQVIEWDKSFPFTSFINEGTTLVRHHWHKEIEIIFVCHGILTLGVNDQLVHLNAGEFYLINSGDVHYCLYSPNSERIVIQFDPAIFGGIRFLKNSHFELEHLLECIEKSSLCWKADIKQTMGGYIEALYEEFIQRKAGYEIAVRARLYDMLLLLYREAPGVKKIMQDDSGRKTRLLKLKKIFAYMEENYQKPISLNSIAAYVGFTPTYFSKFFRKHTGTTFWNYTVQYRLTKAQWLLSQEDFSITEIAYNAGFASVKTFNRTFKNEIGLAPTEYRKRQCLKG